MEDSENTTITTETAKPAVFVHSGFRTSSTWLWTKFRENRATISFSEIFHEDLLTLDYGSINYSDAKNWNSRHPDSAPYLMEYLPLLKPAGGVSHFKAEMSMNQYVPDDGINGELSTSEKKYVQQLIDLARLTHRTPVLTCTRTLGRITGLKNAFGGFHILLIRNLFSQWQSYMYQLETGNPYFISTVLRILDNHPRDKFLTFLRDYLVQRNGEALSTDICKIEDLFLVFLLTHLYLYINAIEHVDYVFDVTSAAAFQPQELDATSHAIYEQTGLHIDIQDIRNETAPSIFILNDPGTTQKTAEIIFDIACQLLNASPVQVRFGKRLLHETFTQYKAILPILERYRTDLGGQATPGHAASPNHTMVHSGEYEVLKEEYERLVVVKDRIESELGQAQARQESIQTEYERLIAVKSDLDADILRKDSTHETLKTEYETALRLKAEMEAVVAEDRAAHEALKSEYETALRLKTEMEAVVAEDRAAHEALKSEYETALRLKTEMEGLASENHAAYEALKTEYEQVLKIKAEIENEIADNQGAYEALKSEYEAALTLKTDMETRIAEWQKKSDDQQALYNTLEEEYRRAVQVKDRLDVELAQIQTKNSELQALYDQLAERRQIEIADLETRIRQADNLQIELDGRTEALKDSQRAREDALAAWRSEQEANHHANESLKQKQEDIEKLSVRVEYYLEEVRKLNDTIEEQDELIARTNSINAGLTDMLERLRSRPALERLFNKQ